MQNAHMHPIGILHLVTAYDLHYKQLYSKTVKLNLQLLYISCAFLCSAGTLHTYQSWRHLPHLWRRSAKDWRLQVSESNGSYERCGIRVLEQVIDEALHFRQRMPGRFKTMSRLAKPSRHMHKKPAEMLRCCAHFIYVVLIFVLMFLFAWACWSHRLAVCFRWGAWHWNHPFLSCRGWDCLESWNCHVRLRLSYGFFVWSPLPTLHNVPLQLSIFELALKNLNKTLHGASKRTKSYPFACPDLINGHQRYIIHIL